MASGLSRGNARVVNENTERRLDVLIKGGRIAEVGADLQSRPAGLLHKSGWAPFDGVTFGSRIDTVLLSGHIAGQEV